MKNKIWEKMHHRNETNEGNAGFTEFCTWYVDHTRSEAYNEDALWDEWMMRDTWENNRYEIPSYQSNSGRPECYNV